MVNILEGMLNCLTRNGAIEYCRFDVLTLLTLYSMLEVVHIINKSTLKSKSTPYDSLTTPGVKPVKLLSGSQYLI